MGLAEYCKAKGVAKAVHCFGLGTQGAKPKKKAERKNERAHFFIPPSF